MLSKGELKLNIEKHYFRWKGKKLQYTSKNEYMDA
jgi:hypothetical protein